MSISSGNSSAAIGNPPIITLLTDFGLRDPYVASMKAVVLSICRKATLIDISHEVVKFRISQGAYLLAGAVPYFPPGTIHLCVVDPGVGTGRKALLVRTKRSCLIGPDNGVLMLAANKEGIEKVIEIKSSEYTREKVSPTFHGRDIFAPAAAHLANGVPIEEFGPQIEDYHIPPFTKPSISCGTAVGEIIYIDDFGNIITNISSSDIDKLNIRPGHRTRIAVGRRVMEMGFFKTYGDVNAGQHLVFIGSTGFLEISVNMGNAAELHKAKEGTGVSVSRV